jgi:amino acid adenylation domain-containing protein
MLTKDMSIKEAATEVCPLARTGISFVHQMIRHQAARVPATAAVICKQSAISYGELDDKSSRLAHYLQRLGIGPEDVVGLRLTRTPQLIIAALAILKAGAAYMPIDPMNPIERQIYMLRDSAAKAIITHSAPQEFLDRAPCPSLILDREWDTIANYSPDILDCELCPDNLAYVIYTSGSTGVPKGVEITHCNLINLISWHNRAFHVSSSDRASQLAGLGFDASVWETWPYLATGASLILAASDTLLSAEELRAWIVRNEITIGFVPTPLAEKLVRMKWPAETRLRVLLTGGDTMRVYPDDELPFTVVNNYGPSECTVVSTSAVVRPREAPVLPPIGIPIDNTEVHILDDTLQPVPNGTPGELYIAGANVGRGYRNHPELTSPRFISNPLGNGKMYRTGDLGRYLPDGHIAFQGRIDNQVKIRGYRIEPDEIAAALSHHAAISTSIVTTNKDENGDSRLIAYFVANVRVSRRELQEFLLERLPEYMVPSLFVVVDNLPLNSNGKIDVGALPPPTAENTLSDSSGTASSLEASLGEVVSELLHLSEVGPDDDFFLLGGHSLLGTQLIARIRERFDVEVPLLTLFERPTIRALSAEIDRLLTARIRSMSEEEALNALREADGKAA